MPAAGGSRAAARSAFDRASTGAGLRGRRHGAVLGVARFARREGAALSAAAQRARLVRGAPIGGHLVPSARLLSDTTTWQVPLHGDTPARLAFSFALCYGAAPGAPGRAPRARQGHATRARARQGARGRGRTRARRVPRRITFPAPCASHSTPTGPARGMCRFRHPSQHGRWCRTWRSTPAGDRNVPPGTVAGRPPAGKTGERPCGFAAHRWRDARPWERGSPSGFAFASAPRSTDGAGPTAGGPLRLRLRGSLVYAKYGCARSAPAALRNQWRGARSAPARRRLARAVLSLKTLRSNVFSLVSLRGVVFAGQGA